MTGTVGPVSGWTGHLTRGLNVGFSYRELVTSLLIWEIYASVSAFCLILLSIFSDHWEFSIESSLIDFHMYMKSSLTYIYMKYVYEYFVNIYILNMLNM